MQEDLKSGISFYNPTFFKMHVDTEDSLHDLNALSDVASAKFLHEYIHFIQDITTVFGLLNISYVVDFIKHVNYVHKRDGRTEIAIPYVIDDKSSIDMYLNTELLKMYIGSTLNITAASLKSVIKEINNSEYNVLRVPRIKLEMKLPNGQDISYYFGVDSIRESMAYEIEQRIYPDLIQQPDDVPYRTARKIVEYYNPSLLEIPNCLIALLDASLLYQNPADIFVRVLEELKQYDIGMLYDAKIYEIAEKVQPFTYNGNISAEQYLISQSIISGGQLATYFTSEIFGKTGYWISNLLGCAIDLRQKVRHFPCTIASGGKIQGNEVFRYIFDLLGTPLMSNNLGDNFFYSRLQEKISNINPQNLWAINQVYNIYINSEKSQMCRCQLKQWCSKTCLDNHQVDYTDNRCFDNPWERVNDEELCQFAQIWRTWGMEGFVPTERSQ